MRMVEELPEVGLCICADDYGLDAGVNAAVAQLAGRGRLQATGALVGAPAWRQGLHWLRGGADGGLEVGLHLDFTEAPLTPGARHRLPALIAQSYVGSLDAAMVRAEIRAQLDAFEDGLGRAPAFVDGHQHVHQLPVIRRALLEELARRYPASGPRPWLRDTRGRWAGMRVPGLQDAIKAGVIAALGARALSAGARAAGFRQNRGFLGVYGFAGGQARYARLLRGWLAAARPGDLLMCHPGDGAGDALAAARQAEFAVLAAPALDDWLAQERVRLLPMCRLLAA